MTNRPTYFMGHQVIYDPYAMEYIIHDDHGNSVKVGELELENDPGPIVDVINSWTVTSPANPSAFTATQVAKSKPDLRDVSTRDLLNEAFRRGAIKQMKRKVAVHNEYMHDPEYVKHVQISAIHDSLLAAKDKLLSEGVFHLATGHEDRFNGTLEYSAEYFICKHPLTLKKEGDYAWR